MWRGCLDFSHNELNAAQSVDQEGATESQKCGLLVFDLFLLFVGARKVSAGFVHNGDNVAKLKQKQRK